MSNDNLKAELDKLQDHMLNEIKTPPPGQMEQLRARINAERETIICILLPILLVLASLAWNEWVAPTVPVHSVYRNNKRIIALQKRIEKLEKEVLSTEVENAN